MDCIKNISYICNNKIQQFKTKNMTVIDAKLLEVTNSEIFRSELRTLKMAEAYRKATEKKLRPLFNALFDEVPLVYNPEFAEYCDTTKPMTWDNTYLLEKECFNELLRRKAQIQLDNGYDVDHGHCVILMAETQVRESIFRLVKMYQEVDETYEDVLRYLNIYRKFKDAMLDFSQKLV